MAEIGTAYINVEPRFDPNIPRLQILELPHVEVGAGRSETPFVLILDGIDLKNTDVDLVAIEELKTAIGAKAVLVTKARIAV